VKKEERNVNTRRGGGKKSCSGSPMKKAQDGERVRISSSSRKREGRGGGAEKRT